MSFAGALALWLLPWVVMRSSRRAALVVSLFLVLFYIYGRALGAIGSKTAPWLLPMVAAGILLLGFLFFGRPRGEFGGLTVFLNLVSMALVVINLVMGVPAFLRGDTSEESLSRTARADTANLPDIYSGQRT